MSAVVDLDDFAVARAGGVWCVGYEKCRTCGREFVGVAPSTADLDALECPGCGEFTAEMHPTAAAAARVRTRPRRTE